MIKGFGSSNFKATPRLITNYKRVGVTIMITEKEKIKYTKMA